MFPPQLHQTTAAPHNCQYLQQSSDHPSIHELLFWLGCYQNINRGSSTLHIWPLLAPSCSWAGYVLLFCIVHMCTWTPSNLPLYKLYPNQCPSVLQYNFLLTPKLYIDEELIINFFSLFTSAPEILFGDIVNNTLILAVKCIMLFFCLCALFLNALQINTLSIALVHYCNTYSTFL